MRTLKKALSLVLVLAMVFTLAVPALAVDKAADFKDYDKVTNKEAVDVLTAVGVLNGNTDGTFGPEGNFTRAQGATMIAYLTLGKTVADALPTSATKFSDVPANFWGAKYIQYCANEGIINGYGNGKFGPDDELTSAQWALMLLGALGYSSKNEGIGGNGWEVATTKLAIQAGVASADELTGTFNRDAAAKMAMNILTATEVYYEGGSTITVNGATIVSGAVRKEVENKTTEYREGVKAGDTNTVGATTMQFCEDHFKDLIKTTAGNDDFGRPARGWTLKGKTLGTYGTVAADYTYTTAMNEKDLFNAVGAEGIKGSSAMYIVMDEIWVDGVKVATSEPIGTTGQYQATANSNASYKDSVIIAKGDTSNIAGFGNGTTVELFATDKANHYIMVAVNEHLGTVKSVTNANSTTGTDRFITITGAGTFTTDEFAKNDTVLYTIANGTVKSVKPPETVSGKVTKITNNSVYTIDGNDYKVSQYNTAPTLSMGTEGTWYLDSCGNIIANKSATKAEIYYGYLLAYGVQNGNDADLFGAGAKDNGERFKFVDANGNIVVKDGAFKTDKNGKVTAYVASKVGSTVSLSGTTWEDGTTADKLFAYEMNAKGEITKVYDAESYRRNNATVTQGTPMFDGARGTDKTVYFMIDSANKQYAAYVGYSNVPTKTAIAGYDRIISYDDVNALNAVAIFVSDVGGTTAKDFVYFAGTDKTEVLNENNELVVTYTNVYVNGEKGELKFDSVQSGIQVGDVYEFTTSTKTGLSTLGTERIDGSATGTEITSIQSGYFTVSGNTYVFTDKDTVYYEIDKTNKTVTVVDGLTALSQNDAYSVNKLYNDKGTSVTDAADVVFFYVGE